MKRNQFLTSVFALLLLINGCEQATVISLESLLQEMIDREQLTRYPDPGFTNKQFSSYDRATTTPEDQSWYANWDRSMFLAVDSSLDRKEYVMYDAEGPGAVVRFWMTFAGEGAGEGTLRIYLDGDEDPVIEGRAFDVLSGELVANSLLCSSVSPKTNYKWRGHNFYLPLPYTDHCRITYESENIVGKGAREGEAVYYNINYRTYEEGTKVVSYSKTQLDQSDSLLQVVKQKLTDPAVGEDSWQSLPFITSLKPGSKDSLTLTGSQAIRHLAFKVPPEVKPAFLRRIVLEMKFDGERTVWAPLGDFFGTGYQIKPFQTFYNQVDSMGNLQSFWVMPFREEAVLVLHNYNDFAVTFEDAKIGYSPYSWDERSLHFGASWHQYTDLYTGEMKNNEGEGNPFDITFTRLQGEGVYAGDVLTLYNTAYAWWGEGDEKIWVDDEDFPSHVGTGTEDYFGYAWCRPEEFSHPFIAQPSGSGNFNPGYTVNLRQRALDKIPFRDSIRVDMEMWHWVSTNINYAPTSFFYLKPGGKIMLEKDLAGVEAKIALQRQDIIPPVATNGQIEAENMVLDSLGNGRISFQYGADWGLSNNKQLFWQEAEPGDQLDLSFISETGGRHPVDLFYTKAPDYGDYQLFLNGSPLTGTIEGYAEEVQRDQLQLGEHALKKGENTLSIRIQGRSPTEDRAFVGIDALIFNLDQARREGT